MRETKTKTDAPRHNPTRLTASVSTSLTKYPPFSYSDAEHAIRLPHKSRETLLQPFYPLPFLYMERSKEDLYNEAKNKIGTLYNIRHQSEPSVDGYHICYTAVNGIIRYASIDNPDTRHSIAVI